MKKNHLWFILALSCLVSSCDSALTFDVQCNEDNKEQSFCYNNKIYKCTQDDNNSEYSWKDSNQECIETTVVACQSGETKCIQGNIHTCTLDGKWPEKATTECGEIGCSEGTIQPASTPLKCFECGVDEAKCDENKLITCNNHKLTNEVCDNGCMTTETNAYCRECKDDELKCEKGFIVSCVKDGDKAGKWDDDHKQSCSENGCFPGARGTSDDVKCYECNTDNLKCFRDESTKVETIKKCLAHNWYDDEVCEFGCAEGTTAACKECNKDKYSNDANGYCVKQVCKDGRLGEPMTNNDVSCNKAMNDIGECLSGSSRCNKQGAFEYCEDGSWKDFGISCDSNDPCALLGNNNCIGSGVGQICSEDGKSLIACPNNASCKSDKSGCAECQSGTSKCDNNILLECPNGVYQETMCAANTHCEVKNGTAQCIKHDCENGAQRCQGNTIQECENYQWKTKNACGNGEQCKENGGIAACSCTSGNSYCNDDNQAISCTDGQWQTTNCSSMGQKCSDINGKATCIECESGTKCQDETKIMTCQNNTWSAATSCTDGMKCTGDSGSAKCVCAEGQAKCASDKIKIIRCKNGTYDNANTESCSAGQHCEGVAGSAICTDDTLECSPGEKQCSGNTLMTCNNGKWETQTCEMGCDNMACNVCTGNEKICENNYLKTCDNGQWKKTYCGVGCYDNTQCNICPPKTSRCHNNTLQTCLGNEWKEEKCPFKCTIVNEYEATCKCSPGSVECVADKSAMICNQSSEWESKSCPQGCKNSVCKECKNETKCENGNYFKCSNKGKWIDGTCEHGCNEETDKCYPECTPGSKKCSIDKKLSYTCNSNGYWGTSEEGGTYCLNGCDINSGKCNEGIDICNTGDTKCVNDNKGMAVCMNNNWLTIDCRDDSCSNNKCSKLSGECSMGACKLRQPSKDIHISIPCNDRKYDYSSLELCLVGCNTCYNYL